MRKQAQKGFTSFETVLLIVIATLIIGVGYYVHSHKLQTNKTATADKATALVGENNMKSPSIPTKALHFGDNPALITKKSDISKYLPGIGNDLKQYFEQNVGRKVELPGGSVSNPLIATRNFSVSDMYGNYAVGTSNIYQYGVVWGPKVVGHDSLSVGDVSNNKIAVIVSTQNGFSCSDLKKAHVPAKLFTGTHSCVDEKGKMTMYTD